MDIFLINKEIGVCTVWFSLVLGRTMNQTEVIGSQGRRTVEDRFSSISVLEPNPPDSIRFDF